MKKNYGPGWVYLLLIAIFAMCPPLAAVFTIFVALCSD